MLLKQFDYELPHELIAQEPAHKRDASRLLVLGRNGSGVTHRKFTDLPEFLVAGDVLVINNTRVFPARLTGIKAGSGGIIEALLVERTGDKTYEAYVKGRVKSGARLLFGGKLPAVVGEDKGMGRRSLEFDCKNLDAAINEIGMMPLPPYIKPSDRDDRRDRKRYQTVYASRTGAVAAPTAGLHFTREMLAILKAKGVTTVELTLHVGPGTFLPVREDVVENHKMHEEMYEVTPEAADALNAAISEGRRIIAVGTTSARTLESAAGEDGRIVAGSGGTRLFIYPGYKFKALSALITNFHLPKSTLLMLICAFAGMDSVMAAYAEAVSERYRFFSYGDAMLII